jgi:hypothetical protein
MRNNFRYAGFGITEARRFCGHKILLTTSEREVRDRAD